MSAVAKLNELLFENTDKIPEGLYLELMNLTKDIFNEKQVPPTPPEPIIYLLRNMRIVPRELYEPRTIALYDACSYRIRDIEVGKMIQLTAYGKDKIFLEIQKVNKCSVKVLKRCFIWSVLNSNYKIENYYSTIKIAEKYELNDSGVLYLDLRSKDLRFYDYPQSKISQNYQYCMLRLGEPTN